jgi:hypothetical protein
MLIINKMPRTKTLRKNTEGPKTMEECEKTTKEAIFKKLGCREFANVISIPNDTDVDEEKELAGQMYDMFAKSGDINKGILKTWTERLSHYQSVVNGTISDEKGAEHVILELEGRRNGVQKDLQWHESRVHDCTIAAVSVGWIPIFGTISAIGLGAAVVASNNEIPVLKEELRRIDQQIADMRNTKTRRTELVQDATKKLQYMKSIFN